MNTRLTTPLLFSLILTLGLSASACEVQLSTDTVYACTSDEQCIDSYTCINGECVAKDSPAADTTTPVEDTTTPVEDITTPVEDTTAPVEDTTTPVEDTTTPVEDTTAPVEDTTTPVEDTTQPIEDATEPVEDVTEPVEDVIEDVEDVTEPVEDVIEDVIEDVTEPVECEVTTPTPEGADCNPYCQTGCGDGEACVLAGQEIICLTSGESKLGTPCDPGTSPCEVGLSCIPMTNVHWTPLCQAFCTDDDDCFESTCGEPLSTNDGDIRLCLPAPCDDLNTCCVDLGGCKVDGVCIEPGVTSPDTPCLVCDPEQSSAGWSPATNGTTACDDDDPCTTGDTCLDGSCAAGTPTDCPDDPCLDAFCQPDASCEYAPKDSGTACQNTEGASGTCDGLGECVTAGCPAPPEGVACNPHCPVGEQGCDAQIVCAVNLENDLACMPSGDLALGDVCDPTTNGCSAGLACLKLPADDEEPRCHAFCQADADCVTLGLTTCSDVALLSGFFSMCEPSICLNLDGCIMDGVCGCLIDEVCIASGAPKAVDEPCWECNPGSNMTGWSEASDLVACDDGDPCSLMDHCDGVGNCAPGQPSGEPECAGGTCGIVAPEDALCNPYCDEGEQGCTFGESCIMTQAVNWSSFNPTCTPTGDATIPIDQPCQNTPNECASGMACVSLASGYVVCTPLCVDDAHCPEGRTCTGLIAGPYYEGVEEPQESLFGHCNGASACPGCFIYGSCFINGQLNTDTSEPCLECNTANDAESWSPVYSDICYGAECDTPKHSPLAECNPFCGAGAQGCMAGEACIFDSDPSLNSSAVCRPIASALQGYGEGCTDGECATGLFCIILPEADSGTCNHICSADKPCPEDFECTSSISADDAVVGICEPLPCAGGCLIDEVCYSAGQGHPTLPCKHCNPDQAENDWSLNQDAPCEDGNPCTQGSTCSSGICANGDIKAVGTPCTSISALNALYACDFQGVCDFSACEPSFVDCNDSMVDGCEAELLSDPLNCGGCEVACSESDSPANVDVCVDGSCQVVSCGELVPDATTVWSDANNDPSDGCEFECPQTFADCSYEVPPYGLVTVTTSELAHTFELPNGTTYSAANVNGTTNSERVWDIPTGLHVRNSLLSEYAVSIVDPYAQPDPGIVETLSPGQSSTLALEQGWIVASANGSANFFFAQIDSALGTAQGTSDSCETIIVTLPEETCNGLDDDCDGLTDEGIAGAETNFDADQFVDCMDPDIDGDGVENDDDPDDYNPSLCGDSDDDGCDDCSAGLGAPDITQDGLDTNGDGVCNVGDDDDDDDGIPDTDDTCPLLANTGIDSDIDGYDAVCDCDDDKPTINPGMDELCDGVDTNCDGVLPDDEVDSDADGYVACGYSGTMWFGDSGEPNVGKDCGEGNEEYAVQIADEELCDGVDTDCDGEIPLAELDLDNDDYVECVNSDGEVWIGGATNPPPSEGYGDCDPNRGQVHPGANEVCDGVKNDCLDPGDPTNPEIDHDQDGYIGCEVTDGWSADSPQPPLEIDCDNHDHEVNPGAEEICDGIDTDCSHPPGDPNGPAEFERDVDGDGYVACDYDVATWKGWPGLFGGNDCNDNFESAWIANCEGKTCGDDACGGSCGTCSGGESCLPVEGEAPGLACALESVVYFRLHLSCAPGVEALAPSVMGDWNGWCPTCDPLSDDDGDGIWTLAVALPQDAYFRFRFLRSPGEDEAASLFALDGEEAYCLDNPFAATAEDTFRSVYPDGPVVQIDTALGTCGLCPQCGDNEAEGVEACDNGDDNTDNGQCAYGEQSCTFCSTSCTEVAGTVTGYCGDGAVQEAENCENCAQDAGCTEGEACTQGTCGPPCTPDCVDKLCGGDGCGGSCGTCTSSEHCVDMGDGYMGCSPL